MNRISHHIQDTHDTGKGSVLTSPTSKNTTGDKSAHNSSSLKGISSSCLIHGTVLMAPTFSNQGTPERETGPTPPATKPNPMVAKPIPQSSMARIRIPPIPAMAAIPKLPTVSISLASRKCSTHPLQALDQSVINLGSKENGLNNATSGTAASLTSTNNFINFCLGKTITDGQQIKPGSCNPTPMGDLPSSDKIPSAKFVTPANLATVKSNTPFTMKVAFNNIELGTFTNPDSAYFAAPQQINKDGTIIGHTHFVIEAVGSLTSTKPTDPLKFAFFKGIDNATDADGTVSTDVTAGLPNGVYRLATLTTAANHQNVNVPIAQHGTVEDAIYVGRPFLLCRDTKLNSSNNNHKFLFPPCIAFCS
jgi:hypothetical protein